MPKKITAMMRIMMMIHIVQVCSFSLNFDTRFVSTRILSSTRSVLSEMSSHSVSPNQNKAAKEPMRTADQPSLLIDLGADINGHVFCAVNYVSQGF